MVLENKQLKERKWAVLDECHIQNVVGVWIQKWAFLTVACQANEGATNRGIRNIRI